MLMILVAANTTTHSLFSFYQTDNVFVFMHVRVFFFVGQY